MKKAIFVITLTLVALVSAGSAIGCTKKPSLTGTWTINSGGSFDAGPSGNGTFGRDFIITVKQENTALQGKGKDVSQGRSADLVGKEVILNGEVKDGSKVTFTIHEDFPAKGEHADLVHEFTGAVSGGKITGTFQGGFDAYGITYRIKGQFVVSVDSTGSTTTPTMPSNTTTSTKPTSSQPMDLKGTTWSGTEVQSQPGSTVHYNLVINVQQQYGDTVIAQFTATGQTANDGGYMGPFVGKVSGSTVTWRWDRGWTLGSEGIEGIDWSDSREDRRVQVSGNSMTGRGEYTDTNGTTHSWSYNLTRVP